MTNPHKHPRSEEGDPELKGRAVRMCDFGATGPWVDVAGFGLRL